MVIYGLFMQSPLRHQRNSPGFKRLRLPKRSRIEDLAREAEVSVSHLSKIERGCIDRIDARLARRVATAYRVPFKAVEVTVYGEKSDWRLYLSSPEWLEHERQFEKQSNGKQSNGMEAA